MHEFDPTGYEIRSHETSVTLDGPLEDAGHFERRANTRNEIMPIARELARRLAPRIVAVYDESIGWCRWRSDRPDISE